MKKRVGSFFLILGSLLIISCTKKEAVPYNDISFYQNVSESQFAGTSVEKAVVLMDMGRSSGTGFFVSSDGVVVTNNHVLGSGQCVQEGCFIKIHKDFQKGGELEETSVFAKPLHIDKVADIAVHQLYEVQKSSSSKVLEKTNQKINTPYFLKMSSQSAASFVGIKAYTIGHPQGALKKVTELEVLETNGQDLSVAGAVISGQSGSPVVDQAGTVIGIVKTGQFQFTELSNNGLNTQGGVAAISELAKIYLQSGTSLKLQSGQETELSELYSIEDEVLSEHWAKRLNFFVMAKRLPKKLANQDLNSLLDQLAQRCGQYVKNKKDGLISALEQEEEYSISDCYNMSHFFSCSEDSEDKAWEHVTCPTDEKRQEYGQYFIDLFESEIVASGNFRSGLLRLATDYNDKLDYETLFSQYVSQYNPQPTFSFLRSFLSIELSKGVQRPYYQGVDLVEKFKNYKSNSNYKYFVGSIVNGLISLYIMSEGQLVDSATIDRVVQGFLLDPEVSLGDKFGLEVFAQQTGMTF